MLKRIVPVLLARSDDSILRRLGGKRTDSLKDGWYYTAQAAEYNDGWKRNLVTLASATERLYQWNTMQKCKRLY